MTSKEEHFLNIQLNLDEATFIYNELKILRTGKSVNNTFMETEYFCEFLGLLENFVDYGKHICE